MATFDYQGRNSQRKLVSGSMDAFSADGVAEKLLTEHITPTSIVERKKTTSLFGFLQGRLIRPHVNAEELETFCRQMYTLTKAGVPIVATLSKLAETMHSKAMVDMLRGAVETISAGQPLSVALKKYPAIFRPVFISIIEAGENSGQLEESFLQLSDYFALELRTIKQIKSATRYPLTVIIVLSLAFAVINFMVIPAFVKLFAQFKAKLPLPTRFLIGMSSVMTHYWPLLLLGIVVIAIAIRFMLKTPAGKLSWDRWKLKLPIFGPLLHRIILARFARTFAMIIRTGVPLIEGLPLVANVVGNEYIKTRVLAMTISIEAGETLTRTALASHLFTPLVIQMISVGEETGAVDTLLRQVAEFYEREVDYDLKRLGDLIEPVMLVLMAIFVLILALGVFLPMWDMASFAQAR
ncbi:MAG: type II secretion system F family protein [Pseudomonadota bacterium]